MLPKTGKNHAFLYFWAFTLLLSFTLAEAATSTVDQDGWDIQDSQRAVSTKKRNDFHLKQSQMNDVNKKKKKKKNNKVKFWRDKVENEIKEAKIKAKNRVSNYIPEFIPSRESRLAPVDLDRIVNRNVNKNININTKTWRPNRPLATFKKNRNRDNDRNYLTSRRNINFSNNNNNNKIDNSNIDVGEKLLTHFYLALELRELVLRRLGYMIQSKERMQLTGEQFKALYHVHELVREKRIYFFDLLPPVIKFLNSIRSSENLNQEFELMLKILSKNLPKYLRCTAHYLVREFNKGHLYAKQEDLSHLSNFIPVMNMDKLKKTTLSTVDVVRLQIEPQSENEKLTQTIFGPIFVNIMRHLRDNKMPFSQKLFGIILAHIPISPQFPMYEEGIIQIYELSKSERIPKWDKIQISTSGDNMLELIRRVIKNLLKVQEMNSPVIEALIYVSILLSESAHFQPNLAYNHIQTEFTVIDDKAITLPWLLASIVYPVFSNDAVKAKDILIEQIKMNKFDNNIFHNVNRFTYDNLEHLLMAVLIAWKNAKIGDDEVVKPISILLSNLIFKERKDVSIFLPPTAHITDVLPAAINDSQEMKSEIDTFTNNIIIPFELWSSPLITMYNKTECVYPKQCLLNFIESPEFARLYVTLPGDDKRLINSIKVYIVNDYEPPAIMSPKEPETVLTIIFPSLPTPSTPEATEMHKLLITFIMKHGLLNPKDADPSGTLIVKSKQLHEILQNILTMDEALKDPKIIEAVNHYLNLMKKHKLIPSLIVRQEGRTERELEIDLDNLFKRVINYDKLDGDVKANYHQLMSYLEKNPHVIGQAKLDLFKFKTKGQLAQYILKKLSELDIIEQKIRMAAKLVMVNVNLDGAGSEHIVIQSHRVSRRKMKKIDNDIDNDIYNDIDNENGIYNDIDKDNDNFGE